MLIKLSKVSIYKSLGDDCSNEEQIVNMIDNNDIRWRPRLVYGGFLFDYNYFAVCTTKISGSMLGNAKLSSIKIQECKKAMELLHEQSVVHLDIRRPNFVFVKSDTESYACVLDFGFSKIISRENELFSQGVAKDLADFAKNLEE